MPETYNIYCDESGHLENDHHPVMVLGAVACPTAKAKEIADRIREIKKKHGFAAEFEIKWTKVSPAGLRFYLDIVDYFFDDDDLHFRGLIAEKAGLRHEDFRQDHDTWYFKMYFEMLKALLEPTSRFRIYVDIKDTRSAAKVRMLHDVLCTSIYDFSKDVLERVQTVRSHEVEQLQLADLLIGAVSYANRKLETSPAKTAIIDRMRRRSSYSLTRSTLLKESKFNLFKWRPQVSEQ